MFSLAAVAAVIVGLQFGRRQACFLCWQSLEMQLDGTKVELKFLVYNVFGEISIVSIHWHRRPSRALNWVTRLSIISTIRIFFERIFAKSKSRKSAFFVNVNRYVTDIKKWRKPRDWWWCLMDFGCGLTVNNFLRRIFFGHGILGSAWAMLKLDSPRRCIPSFCVLWLIAVVISHCIDLNQLTNS